MAYIHSKMQHNTIAKVQDKYKTTAQRECSSTDVVNWFYISLLIELSDNFGDSMP